MPGAVVAAGKRRSRYLCLARLQCRWDWAEQASYTVRLNAPRSSSATDPSKLSPATLIDGGIVGTKVASRAVSGKAAAIVVGAARRKSAGAQTILSAREMAPRFSQSETSHGSFPGASQIEQARSSSFLVCEETKQHKFKVAVLLPFSISFQFKSPKLFRRISSQGMAIRYSTK